MKLSAFQTHRGLMEFTRMPFGAVCACATYVSLMRLVLDGLTNVCFYFDNIFIHSVSWQDHLQALTAVLARLRHHGLTARPSKCRFGYQEAQYLGFIVGRNSVAPKTDKIKPLLSLKPPTTKKNLKSLLGLVSFYRKFIPGAATLTAPLTEMLRKTYREPLIWDRQCTENLGSLKTLLASDPVLALPDVVKTFILRTDASLVGLGAVLLQYHEDVPRPVAYASRKLLPREQRYSTIERECLAIVFGVDKFKFYLMGKEFVLEVDHRPLVYLNKFKGSNSRLVRWALSLQPYRFRTIYIPGAENVGADLLSRTVEE